MGSIGWGGCFVRQVALLSRCGRRLTLSVLRQVTELFEESKSQLEQRTAEVEDKRQR